MEAGLVKREGVPFEAIPAAGVAGVGARAMPGNLLKLARGFSSARKLLRSFRPEVMLFTGGYVAVPVALAGRTPIPGLKRPRSLLFVPDIEPGLALKTLVRWADHIAVSAEESRGYFPGHPAVTVTGYPVRRELNVLDRSEARKTLGLSLDLPLVLVLGGSRGARQINRSVLAILPDLLSGVQVVHATGQLDYPEIMRAWQSLVNENKISAEAKERYHPYPYLADEMAAAFSAADIVVSRAGASTLGELPLYGLPAVLVPYPYTWRYQKVNAAYLESRGAAVVLEEAELTERLLPLIVEIMADPARRSQMQEAMRALHHPQAASDIARIARHLAGSEPGIGCEAW
jgi:UDP-N-acetylglucosamine--N-acetylmuramyl-(pentapeptide) pyrophosphoryl-undecaprenol N-acetylglucosamine transferase